MHRQIRVLLKSHLITGSVIHGGKKAEPKGEALDLLVYVLTVIYNLETCMMTRKSRKHMD